MLFSTLIANKNPHGKHCKCSATFSPTQRYSRWSKVRPGSGALKGPQVTPTRERRGCRYHNRSEVPKEKSTGKRGPSTLRPCFIFCTAPESPKGAYFPRLVFSKPSAIHQVPVSQLLPHLHATVPLKCCHTPEKQNHICPFWAEISPGGKSAYSCQQASSIENASLNLPTQGYEVDLSEQAVC